MSLGIYKQGQGYWVRVLSAAAIGILVIAAAAWGWEQAGIVRLPARSWSLSLSNVQGPIEQGDVIAFNFYDVESDDPNTLVRMGSAIVDRYDPGRGSTGIVTISGFEDEVVRSRAGDAQDAYIGQPGEQAMTAIVRGGTPTSIYPILYLQAGVAGGILLLGAIGIFIYVGASKKSVEFLVATDGEMKKVNWTSYREVKGSTIVVIVATFLIAGFLFVVDIVFSNFFSFIKVLEK